MDYLTRSISNCTNSIHKWNHVQDKIILFLFEYPKTIFTIITDININPIHHPSINKWKITQMLIFIHNIANTYNPPPFKM